MQNQPMFKSSIIPKLIQYIKNSTEWHGLGEPTPISDGPGLSMIELESDILTSFGFPSIAFCYSSLLQRYGFDAENVEEKAEELFELLVQEAEAYLLSPARTTTDLLLEYKANWTTAQDALPFLGFDSTLYTGFIYQDIYLQGICSDKELIQHLQFAQDYSQDNVRHIPFEFEVLSEPQCYKHLQKEGLPYLDDYAEYLAYIADKNMWDFDIALLPSQNTDELAEYLTLTLFYITRLEIFNEESVCIDFMFPSGNSFQTITVWCELQTMNYLLRFAHYASMVAHLQLTTNDFNIITLPYVYDMYKYQGKNYEISKCEIILERLPQKEKHDADPLHYSITSIIPLKELVSEEWDNLDNLSF